MRATDATQMQALFILFLCPRIQVSYSTFMSAELPGLMRYWHAVLHADISLDHDTRTMVIFFVAVLVCASILCFCLAS